MGVKPVMIFAALISSLIITPIGWSETLSPEQLAAYNSAFMCSNPTQSQYSPTAPIAERDARGLLTTQSARQAAESMWMMMNNMSGISTEESPILKDMVSRGVNAAPMLERDIADRKPQRLWTRKEYIEQYNRLGATPPPGGYQAYLARAGDAQPKQGHNYPLDQVDHLKDMAVDLGMPGATIKRGRSDASPPVQIMVARQGDPGWKPAAPTANKQLGTEPQKIYDVVAFRKAITYTRFGDHDPEGVLYTLAEDQGRVQNCQGFECGHDPLFFGSRSDPEALSPQPLVLRANVGDTIIINLTNEVDDMPVSIHIHKAMYKANTSAGSVAGFNVDTTAKPGETITYTWHILDEERAEGIYYFYSHVDPRYQVPHGLFGALIVEPRGSRYLDTETGQPLKAGWGAIITNEDPSVRAFREYVVFFQDRLELIDKNGDKPQDFWTGVADAAGKGFSYRTAPFFNMMNLFLDESMAYSAYTFGDFSTPHPRWYLGDPMRVRVIHGGSGEHHVFHNHAHRWRVNPKEADDNLTEPTKSNELDLIFPFSTRIDSQTMGPGEAFDVEMEGGAGGVQRTVGDVLFHCHIIEHVVEGMWSYHRIYNTLQPDLAPLPDVTPPPQAVNSVELVQRAAAGQPAIVHAGGRFHGQAITGDNINDWLHWLLPPPGVPEEELIVDPEHGNRTQNKANRWDWIIQQTAAGPLALGEPYDDFFGPGFPAPGEGVGAGPPGERPELLFNPIDGRLAWPHLKPQLGRRPPFAPIRDGDNDTQGTAYLGLTLDNDSPWAPSGSPLGSGLVPEDSKTRHYDIQAITLPIQYNEHGDIDPDGMIFSLADDVPAIRAGEKPPEPLVLRSNVAEAVQITLRSALEDTAEVDYHSKVGMHIHLVQYDVQSSDGAVAGLNYETSVRPSRDRNGNPIEGRKACGKGNPTDCGPLSREDEEIHTTWFSDVELGTVYWHDHSKLVVSLPHGLFAALIVEPENAQYRDRETGEDKYVANAQGHFSSTNGVTGTQMADIIVPDEVIDPRTGAKRADFREFFFGQNDATRLFGNGIDFAALEHGESRRNPEKGFPSINLRSEHFNHRLAANPDPSLIYSSWIHGDPATPLVKAYVGDPVSIRVEGGGTNSIHVLNFHGHRWRFQRGDPESSPLRDFVVNGQSEAFSFDFEPGAGGLSEAAGDYLYFSGNMDHRREGAWGLFRVHDTLATDLQPLPDRPAPAQGLGFPESVQAMNGERPPKPLGPGNPGAPDDAPIRRFDIVAIDYPIPYDVFNISDDKGKLFVLAEDVEAVRNGTKATEPLVIRANAGEVVEINLSNALAVGNVGLHASLMQYDVQGSDGSAVGYNPDSTVAPGETISYRWYADQELGTVYLYNPANLDDTRHGLFGALIVEPSGSSWRDPESGGELKSGWRADVFPGDGSEPYREFAIFFHDGVDQIRYRVAVNYRTARRNGANEVLVGGPGGVVRDPQEDTVHSSEIWEDPVTPVMQAYAGDRVVIRQLQPAYEDHHVFHLHGHSWHLERGDESSQMIANITDSVGTAYDIELIGGAQPGDHLYHCHIQDHKKMGMWGLFRVFSEPQSNLLHLD